MRGPFVAGSWRQGAVRAAVRSPWDGRVVAEVGLADRALVEEAVEAAARARPAMAALTAAERAAALARIGEGLAARREALAAAIVDEAGKPLSLARGEVDRALETFSFARDEARRLGGEVVPLDAAASGRGRLGIVRRVPAGPVAAISPFNFPLNLLAHKVAPALAAGCPVVAKPASQTPSAALLLAEAAAEAGLPEGALSVLPCPSSEAAPMVEDERVRVLSFTGSREVGHALYRAAGPKRVLLELGGNAAAIVEPDADLAAAAERLAYGAYVYAGQVCISVQRIYVHAAVYEHFLDAFVGAARGLRCGDPRDPLVLAGPVVDDGAAERVEAWVEEAIAAGARAPLRGARRGRLLEPTVLVDVDPALRVSREEVFGPVALVAPYTDLDDAIRRVNDSAYGLQAAVFTRSISELLRAFEGLEVGGVVHDDASTFRVDQMPYGGVKGSGLGREGLRWAVEEMTELRHLVVRR